MLDESLRRLGGILASPSLVTSYHSHTTPLMERSWLRRLGLTKQETQDFLSQMCERGLLDEGAKTIVYALCQKRNMSPDAAARLLLQGEGWPAAKGEEP